MAIKKKTGRIRQTNAPKSLVLYSSDPLIEAAKKFAKAKGRSLSALVNDLLVEAMGEKFSLIVQLGPSDLQMLKRAAKDDHCSPEEYARKVLDEHLRNRPRS